MKNPPPGTEPGEKHALLETARDQIRRGDPTWVKTFLAAWQTAMPDEAETDIRAELLEVLAEGRESQGRLEEAAKCRKTAVELRDTETRLCVLEKELTSRLARKQDKT